MAHFFIYQKKDVILMAICTFLGDNDAPERIHKLLRKSLEYLIATKKTNFFYVNNEGNFNLMAIDELKKLNRLCEQIDYEVIVCNIPHRDYSRMEIFFNNLSLVEGFADSTKEEVLDEIYNWMIDESDYVLVYTENENSNASKYKEIAKNKGKRVFVLKEKMTKPR